MTAKLPTNDRLRRSAWPTLILAAALATGFTPATAQTAASAPVSAAKKELVQTILKMQQQGFEALARQITEQSLGPIEQQVSLALRTRVPEDQRKVVAEQCEGDFKAFADAVGPQLRDIAIRSAPSTVGTLLEQNFDEAELKQLIEQLNSPLTRKFGQLAPQMQQSLSQKIIDEAKPAVTPKLLALQETLMRRLGIPNAGATGAASAAARPAASAAKPAAPKASAAAKK
jgi:hypothetical protein